ncbi:MAG: GNAT family N-acetyltransferase [Tistrella sp.]|jgi:GNAT superfamily N-acetyltransferase|uniref:N-acetyltransferase n=1 Tax=Tistrella mobilis TaxID=171437 RepID=A0A161Q0I3_9PROT|nr:MULTISPECIES: hypothetical protein [Tistrella]KYO50805.1 hypothetical protein AUP44_11385 [Tistrella mobilis]MAD38506.1 GNAT family N-acetyltransferase [Tistrella sp.]MBA79097.1 GNAT family N-acetyltransferase [Tistrella sp.]HAE48260.1 N-acetyltransferase [Tistrella mobilis]
MTELVVTYFEMTSPPDRHGRGKLPSGQYALLRAWNMPVHFYRYLHAGARANLLRPERLGLDDEAIGHILADEKIEIFVLYVAGVPAGFAELDRRAEDDSIEIAYHGLMPEYVGRSFRGFLLDQVVDIAWSYHPTRLWARCSNLDHPKAMQTYQRGGFGVFRQERSPMPADLALTGSDRGRNAGTGGLLTEGTDLSNIVPGPVGEAPT